MLKELEQVSDKVNELVDVALELSRQRNDLQSMLKVTAEQRDSLQATLVSKENEYNRMLEQSSRFNEELESVRAASKTQSDELGHYIETIQKELQSTRTALNEAREQLKQVSEGAILARDKVERLLASFVGDNYE